MGKFNCIGLPYKDKLDQQVLGTRKKNKSTGIFEEEGKSRERGNGWGEVGLVCVGLISALLSLYVCHLISPSRQPTTGFSLFGWFARVVVLRFFFFLLAAVR